LENSVYAPDKPLIIQTCRSENIVSQSFCQQCKNLSNKIRRKFYLKAIVQKIPQYSLFHTVEALLHLRECEMMYDEKKEQKDKKIRKST